VLRLLRLPEDRATGDARARAHALENVGAAHALRDGFDRVERKARREDLLEGELDRLALRLLRALLEPAPQLVVRAQRLLEAQLLLGVAQAVLLLGSALRLLADLRALLVEATRHLEFEPARLLLELALAAPQRELGRLLRAQPLVLLGERGPRIAQLRLELRRGGPARLLLDRGALRREARGEERLHERLGERDARAAARAGEHGGAGARVGGRHRASPSREGRTRVAASRLPDCARGVTGAVLRRSFASGGRGALPAPPRAGGPFAPGSTTRFAYDAAARRRRRGA
jgi:hypothetical protein